MFQVKLFWVVTLCSVVLGNQQFTCPCCLHHPEHEGSMSLHRFTAQDVNLHRHENLNSFICVHSFQVTQITLFLKINIWRETYISTSTWISDSSNFFLGVHQISKILQDNDRKNLDRCGTETGHGTSDNWSSFAVYNLSYRHRCFERIC